MLFSLTLMTQAEDSLILFKTIFNQSPISTQIFIPDGTTIMVNKAWENLWNVTFKDLGGYNILKDQQLVKTGIMEYIKRGFKGEAVHLPEIRYDPAETVVVHGARVRWLSARMFPIKNSKGQVTHVVLQHMDATDKRLNADVLFRLASIVESSSDAIISKTMDGIITSWNKGAEKLFGYKADEIIGKPILTIIPKELHKEERAIILKIKKGIQISHFETVRLRKDKSTVDVSLSISPIKNEKGKIIGASKIARNITDQKKAEESIRESEARFRTLTSHAPVGIFLTDKDGNCLFVNERWCSFADMKKEDAMGSGWVNALHPDDRDKVAKAWYQFAKNDREFNLEYRFLTPKGSITWLNGTAIALRDNKNRITGYMGTVADITDRKLALDSLKIGEERLRLALEAGKIGVWDWDVIKNTLTWTDRVYEIHGVDRKTFEVTFDNFLRFIHPDDKKRVITRIEKSLLGEEEFHIDFRIVTQKGEVKWIFTRATINYDQKGQPLRMLGATLDITHQKQIEQEKSDFISMASHELKTPITGMKMFAELLNRELQKTNLEKPLHFANRIKEQTNRLIELTNDLLDVSRIETGKLQLRKEKFDLSELIHESVETLQPTTTHKLIVKNNINAFVVADRYRVYQVLVNLITNAVKYSPQADKVIIAIKTNSNEVVISVKDNGIGIAKNKQAKIFDRLYQVTDSKLKTYPGLGLGLYITKEIVERHNGRLWLKSTAGKGSTFYFSLALNNRSSKI